MNSTQGFFPYTQRMFQSDIMDNINTTLENWSHIVLESGTGTGKTICILAPVLKYAMENNKKILYCTRTNSQQRQVMYELRAIKKHIEKRGINDFKDRCVGLGMQGRHNLCLLTRDDHELMQSSAEELSRLCSDRKNSVIGEKAKQETTIPGCKYYKRMFEFDMAPLRKWTREELPTAEEILEYCVDNGICPYEFSKSMLSECVIVTAPYIYIFNNFIRRRFLEWFKSNFGDTILVIDEAHNLPDFARELGSMQLSKNTLTIAREEALEFGDPVITDEIRTSRFISILEEILIYFKNEYIMEEDGFVPPDALQVELMTRFSTISNKIKIMIKNLIILGEVIRGKRRKKGRLPRSYIYSVGNFLNLWFEMEAETHVKLIVNGENPKLEAFCMDPSIVTDIIKNCMATIHISGTLRPLEEYRDSIGLPSDTKLKTFPSPFPSEKRKIIYVDDVTTKFENLKTDDNILVKIEKYIQNICNNFHRNTIIFFPSFNLLNELIHRGVHFRMNRRFFMEQQNMSQRRLMDLIETFRTEKGILFAVMGGRISEGMDFPGEDLELVVLVGIPYPRPTARQKALQNYYEKKFNKGWEYTVTAPATRKMLQSIGRLIRTEEDRGIAVILDYRSIHFKDQLEGLTESKDVNSSLSKFFNSQTILI